MEVLRTWWEIPAISHFCSLFASAFQLPDFDIDELEESIIASAAKDGHGSPFLIELICALLKGCYPKVEINILNWEYYLSDIVTKKWDVDVKGANPLSESRFNLLAIRKKVEILHALCDFRLDLETVPDALKDLEGDQLRVTELGVDRHGVKYWYFYGTRLYKEYPEGYEEPESEKPVLPGTRGRARGRRGGCRGRGKGSKGRGRGCLTAPASVLIDPMTGNLVKRKRGRPPKNAPRLERIQPVMSSMLMYGGGGESVFPDSYSSTTETSTTPSSPTKAAADIPSPLSALGLRLNPSTAAALRTTAPSTSDMEVPFHSGVVSSSSDSSCSDSEGEGSDIAPVSPMRVVKTNETDDHHLVLKISRVKSKSVSSDTVADPKLQLSSSPQTDVSRPDSPEKCSSPSTPITHTMQNNTSSALLLHEQQRSHTEDSSVDAEQLQHSSSVSSELNHESNKSTCDVEVKNEPTFATMQFDYVINESECLKDEKEHNRDTEVVDQCKDSDGVQTSVNECENESAHVVEQLTGSSSILSDTNTDMDTVNPVATAFEDSSTVFNTDLYDDKSSSLDNVNSNTTDNYAQMVDDSKNHDSKTLPTQDEPSNCDSPVDIQGTTNCNDTVNLSEINALPITMLSAETDVDSSVQSLGSQQVDKSIVLKPERALLKIPESEGSSRSNSNLDPPAPSTSAASLVLETMPDSQALKIGSKSPYEHITYSPTGNQSFDDTAHLITPLVDRSPSSQCPLDESFKLDVSPTKQEQCSLSPMPVLSPAPGSDLPPHISPIHKAYADSPLSETCRSESSIPDISSSTYGQPLFSSSVKAVTQPENPPICERFDVDYPSFELSPPVAISKEGSSGVSFDGFEDKKNSTGTPRNEDSRVICEQVSKCTDVKEAVSDEVILSNSENANISLSENTDFASSELNNVHGSEKNISLPTGETHLGSPTNISDVDMVSVVHDVNEVESETSMSKNNYLPITDDVKLENPVLNNNSGAASVIQDEKSTHSFMADTNNRMLDNSSTGDEKTVSTSSLMLENAVCAETVGETSVIKDTTVTSSLMSNTADVRQEEEPVSSVIVVTSESSSTVRKYQSTQDTFDSLPCLEKTCDSTNTPHGLEGQAGQVTESTEVMDICDETSVCERSIVPSTIDTRQENTPMTDKTAVSPVSIPTAVEALSLQKVYVISPCNERTCLVHEDITSIPEVTCTFEDQQINEGQVAESDNVINRVQSSDTGDICDHSEQDKVVSSYRDANLTVASNPETSAEMQLCASEGLLLSNLKDIPLPFGPAPRSMVLCESDSDTDDSDEHEGTSSQAPQGLVPYDIDENSSPQNCISEESLVTGGVIKQWSSTSPSYKTCQTKSNIPQLDGGNDEHDSDSDDAVESKDVNISVTKNQVNAQASQVSLPAAKTNNMEHVLHNNNSVFDKDSPANTLLPAVRARTQSFTSVITDIVAIDNRPLSQKTECLDLKINATVSNDCKTEHGGSISPVGNLWDNLGVSNFDEMKQPSTTKSNSTQNELQNTQVKKLLGTSTVNKKTDLEKGKGFCITGTKRNLRMRTHSLNSSKISSNSREARMHSNHSQNLRKRSQSSSSLEKAATGLKGLSVRLKKIDVMSLIQECNLRMGPTIEQYCDDEAVNGETDPHATVEENMQVDINESDMFVQSLHNDRQTLSNSPILTPEGKNSNSVFRRNETCNMNSTNCSSQSIASDSNVSNVDEKGITDNTNKPSAKKAESDNDQRDASFNDSYVYEGVDTDEVAMDHSFDLTDTIKSPGKQADKPELHCEEKSSTIDDSTMQVDDNDSLTSDKNNLKHTITENSVPSIVDKPAIIDKLDILNDRKAPTPDKCNASSSKGKSALSEDTSSPVTNASNRDVNLEATQQLDIAENAKLNSEAKSSLDLEKGKTSTVTDEKSGVASSSIDNSDDHHEVENHPSDVSCDASDDGSDHESMGDDDGNDDDDDDDDDASMVDSDDEDGEEGDCQISNCDEEEGSDIESLDRSTMVRVKVKADYMRSLSDTGSNEADTNATDSQQSDTGGALHASSSDADGGFNEKKYLAQLQRKLPSVKLTLEDKPDPRWRIACSTMDDWNALAQQMANSDVKCEKRLHKTIVGDFLKELPALFTLKAQNLKRKWEREGDRRESHRIKRKKIIENSKTSHEIAAEYLDDDERAVMKKNQQKEEERKKLEKQQKLESKQKEQNAKSRKAMRLAKDRSRRLELRRIRAAGEDIPEHLLPRSRYNQQQIREGMLKVMHMLKKFPRIVWPFVKPVEEKWAPRYYDIISYPMDISKMTNRIEKNFYTDKQELMNDFSLMVSNCHEYNGEDSDFTRMADELHDVFMTGMKRHLPEDSDSSGDERDAFSILDNVVTRGIPGAKTLIQDAFKKLEEGEEENDNASAKQAVHSATGQSLQQPPTHPLPQTQLQPQTSSVVQQTGTTEKQSQLFHDSTQRQASGPTLSEVVTDRHTLAPKQPSSPLTFVMARSPPKPQVTLVRDKFGRPVPIDVSPTATPRPPPKFMNREQAAASPHQPWSPEAHHTPRHPPSVHQQAVHQQTVNQTVVHQTPVQQTPVQQTSVQKSQVHQTPVQPSPVHQTTVQQSRVHETSVQQSQVHETSVQQSQVHQIPIQQSACQPPVPRTPVHHPPVPHTPVRHPPAQHSPVPHTPVRHPPAQQIPPHQAPLNQPPICKPPTPKTPAQQASSSIDKPPSLTTSVHNTSSQPSAHQTPLKPSVHQTPIQLSPHQTQVRPAALQTQVQPAAHHAPIQSPSHSSSLYPTLHHQPSTHQIPVGQPGNQKSVHQTSSHTTQVQLTPAPRHHSAQPGQVRSPMSAHQSQQQQMPTTQHRPIHYRTPSPPQLSQNPTIHERPGATQPTRLPHIEALQRSSPQDRQHQPPSPITSHVHTKHMPHRDHHHAPSLNSGQQHIPVPTSIQHIVSHHPHQQQTPLERTNQQHIAVASASQQHIFSSQVSCPTTPFEQQRIVQPARLHSPLPLEATFENTTAQPRQLNSPAAHFNRNNVITEYNTAGYPVVTQPASSPQVSMPSSRPGSTGPPPQHASMQLPLAHPSPAPHHVQPEPGAVASMAQSTSTIHQHHPRHSVPSLRMPNSSRRQIQMPHNQLSVQQASSQQPHPVVNHNATTRHQITSNAMPATHISHQPPQLNLPHSSPAPRQLPSPNIGHSAQMYPVSNMPRPRATRGSNKRSHSQRIPSPVVTGSSVNERVQNILAALPSDREKITGKPTPQNVSSSNPMFAAAPQPIPGSIRHPTVSTSSDQRLDMPTSYAHSVSPAVSAMQTPHAATTPSLPSRLPPQHVSQQPVHHFSVSESPSATQHNAHQDLQQFTAQQPFPSPQLSPQQFPRPHRPQQMQQQQIHQHQQLVRQELQQVQQPPFNRPPTRGRGRGRRTSKTKTPPASPQTMSQSPPLISRVGTVRPQQQPKTPESIPVSAIPTTTKAKTLGQLSGLVRVVRDDAKVLNKGPTYLMHSGNVALQQGQLGQHELQIEQNDLQHQLHQQHMLQQQYHDVAQRQQQMERERLLQEQQQKEAQAQVQQDLQQEAERQRHKHQQEQQRQVQEERLHEAQTVKHHKFDQQQFDPYKEMQAIMHDGNLRQQQAAALQAQQQAQQQTQQQIEQQRKMHQKIEQQTDNAETNNAGTDLLQMAMSEIGMETLMDVGSSGGPAQTQTTTQYVEDIGPVIHRQLVVTESEATNDLLQQLELANSSETDIPRQAIAHQPPTSLVGDGNVKRGMPTQPVQPQQKARALVQPQPQPRPQLPPAQPQPQNVHPPSVLIDPQHVTQQLVTIDGEQKMMLVPATQIITNVPVGTQVVTSQAVTPQTYNNTRPMLSALDIHQQHGHQSNIAAGSVVQRQMYSALQPAPAATVTVSDKTNDKGADLFSVLQHPSPAKPISNDNQKYQNSVPVTDVQNPYHKSSAGHTQNVPTPQQHQIPRMFSVLQPPDTNSPTAPMWPDTQSLEAGLTLPMATVSGHQQPPPTSTANDHDFFLRQPSQDVQYDTNTTTSNQQTQQQQGQEQHLIYTSTTTGVAAIGHDTMLNNVVQKSDITEEPCYRSMPDVNQMFSDDGMAAMHADATPSQHDGTFDFDSFIQ